VARLMLDMVALDLRIEKGLPNMATSRILRWSFGGRSPTREDAIGTRALKRLQGDLNDSSWWDLVRNYASALTSARSNGSQP
jgi:hypothetical protein